MLLYIFLQVITLLIQVCYILLAYLNSLSFVIQFLNEIDSGEEVNDKED